MDNGRRMHIELDLDPSADPVAGVARSAGQPERAFIGWIALVEAVESCTETEAPKPASAPSDQRAQG